MSHINSYENFNEPLSYDQYDYRDHPLLFSKVSLSEDQKLLLISKFNEWYGNTDQATTAWALEYEVIVRMILAGYLVINLIHLSIDDVKEEMDTIISHIPEIYNSSTDNIREFSRFLLTIEEPYARDTQVYAGDPEDAEITTSEEWYDVKHSALYLGIVMVENEIQAKQEMARFIGCSPEIIKAQKI